MALTLTGGEEYVSWKISGYANPFNTTYYICAGICTKSFTSGTTVEPSGIVDEVSATSSGTRTYSSGSFDYEPGTYTFYSYTQSANGQYWDTGSATVTVDPPEVSAYYTASATPTSITFSVKGVSSASSYWRYFRIFVYQNGTLITRSSWLSKTSNFTWEASDLDQNTTYDISVYVGTSSSGANSTKLSGPTTITTGSIPNVSASYTVSSITDTSVVLSVTGVSSASSYWKYFKAFVVDADGSTVAESSWTNHTSNFSLTLSGLDPNTTYTISVYTSPNSSGSSAEKLSGPTSITTKLPSPKATYTVTEVTTTTVKFSITNVSGSAAYWMYFRAFVVNASGATAASTTWSKHTTNFTLTLDGLTPGREYTVSIYVATDANGSNSTKLSGPTTITTVALPISPWTWEYSNGENCGDDDYLVQNAYKVLNGQLSSNNFSHKVWNDLVDKIMEMRAWYNGSGWTTSNGKYLQYASCQVSKGDNLSSGIYNSVKAQIDSIKSTNINDVSKGDKLTGYHIVHIVDVLNEIINKL